MQIFSKIYDKAWKNIQKKKIEAILDKIKPSGKILDIGSGPGFLEKYLPDAVALDVDLENLKKVKGKKILATGDVLPFEENSFDFIFCIDTIHKLNQKKFFSEVGRVLKKGGILVLSVFCNEYNAEKIDFNIKNFKKKDVFTIKGKEWDKVFVFSKT